MKSAKDMGETYRQLRSNEGSYSPPESFDYTALQYAVRENSLEEVK